MKKMLFCWLFVYLKHFFCVQVKNPLLLAKVTPSSSSFYCALRSCDSFIFEEGEKREKQKQRKVEFFLLLKKKKSIRSMSPKANKKWRKLLEEEERMKKGRKERYILKKKLKNARRVRGNAFIYFLVVVPRSSCTVQSCKTPSYFLHPRWREREKKDAHFKKRQLVRSHLSLLLFFSFCIQRSFSLSSPPPKVKAVFHTVCRAMKTKGGGGEEKKKCTWFIHRRTNERNEQTPMNKRWMKEMYGEEEERRPIKTKNRLQSVSLIHYYRGHLLPLRDHPLILPCASFWFINEFTVMNHKIKLFLFLMTHPVQSVRTYCLTYFF